MIYSQMILHKTYNDLTKHMDSVIVTTNNLQLTKAQMILSRSHQNLLFCRLRQPSFFQKQNFQYNVQFCMKTFTWRRKLVSDHKYMDLPVSVTFKQFKLATIVILVVHSMFCGLEPRITLDPKQTWSNEWITDELIDE